MTLRSRSRNLEPRRRRRCLVEGRSFYQPMLADIEAATSSVHINRFGFRPGPRSATCSRGRSPKARSGVPVKARRRRAGLTSLRHDRATSTPRSSRRTSKIVVTRATSRGRPQAARILFSGALEHPCPRPHRSPPRRSSSTAGSVGLGGAGIEDHFEDGRFHDPVRFASRAPSSRNSASYSSRGFRFLGGSIPEARVGQTSSGIPRPCRTQLHQPFVLHNAPGGYRPISDRDRDLDGAQQISTSSIRTSRTGA